VSFGVSERRGSGKRGESRGTNAGGGVVDIVSVCG